MYQKIKALQLQSRKDGNRIKAKLLTTILGEFDRGASKAAPSDDQVFKVLTKFTENAKSTLLIAHHDEVETELVILEELLSHRPADMTIETLTNHIETFIHANGDSVNIGGIMSFLKGLGQPFDGKAASQIAKDKLMGLK